MTKLTGIQHECDDSVYRPGAFNKGRNGTFFKLTKYSFPDGSVGYFAKRTWYYTLIGHALYIWDCLTWRVWDAL